MRRHRRHAWLGAARPGRSRRGRRVLRSASGDLYVFLTAGCSYTATASRQILHRNTVQYRVRRAEETIGKSISDRRTDLEVALLACQHLGASVLQPPLAPTADEVSHAQPPGSTA
ncbi:helix-turn-helix domain-containing protein [Streptomyces sp. NPDC004646]